MSDLVVKDNALIQASYTLGLTEQRLILLAVIHARDTQAGLSSVGLLEITASSYAKQFNISDDMAYKAMREASEGLFKRYVTYHDKNPKTGRDRSFKGHWVDKIGYEKGSGVVYLQFSAEVIPLITRLEEQFTSYEIEEVSSLTSSYAIRLYELIIQWRTAGKTPTFEVEEFRKQLGVDDSKYKTMSNFKKHVLDFAIKQINKHTDIKATYTQKKKGRVIVGFEFSFKIKKKKEKAVTHNNRDNRTVDMFAAFDMTDKQRDYYSVQLANITTLSHRAKGESEKCYKAFARQIASELLVAENKLFYKPHLSKLGFKFKE